VYTGLHALGINVVAASADGADKVEKQFDDLHPAFAMGCDLSIEQMQTLGLYILSSRSIAESERPFAEPGVFVVNEPDHLQVIDMSNDPFVRINSNIQPENTKHE